MIISYNHFVMEINQMVKLLLITFILKNIILKIQKMKILFQFKVRLLDRILI